MKRLIFISCALLLSSCQFTKQQKAEKLIKNYLNEHLNDPHSYESIKFSQLDTSFSKLEDDTVYRFAIKNIERVQGECEKWKLQNPDDDGISELEHSRALYLEKMDRFFYDDSIEYVKIRDEASEKFKSHFNGWRISHTYRAKNGFGALGLHESGFILNKACDSILDVIDAKE